MNTSKKTISSTNFFRLQIETNSTTGELPTFERDKDTITFGSGVFFVEPTTNSNTMVTMELSEDEDDKTKTAVFIIYERFEGNLIHDPTISIKTPFGITIDIDRDTLIALTVLLFIALGFMIFVFLGVGSSYIWVTTEGCIRDPYGRLIH